MKLREILNTTIREYLNENHSLKPISNIKAFDILRPRGFDKAIGELVTREFLGKNGFRYYIVERNDTFQVIDADDLDKQLETGKPILFKTVGYAAFDNTNKDYFTGYKEAESIRVDKEHRRNGVATAITKFAEEYFNKPYKPTDLLSSDMEHFVKNYFKK